MDKEEICKERGYHSFNNKEGCFDLDCLRFESEEGDEVVVVLTCNECDKTAECQGTFEE